jgi:hypothetical protein
MFRKLDLFPSWGGGETPILLGPLERANLSHWNQKKKGRWTFYATNLSNKPSPWKHCIRLMGEFVKPFCSYCYHHLWSKNWTLRTKTSQKPMKNLSHHSDLCELLTTWLEVCLFCQCSFFHIHRECYRCIARLLQISFRPLAMWLEARILAIESNSRYRKYKELAYMACLTNLISQPSLNISPVWIPLINNKVSTQQRSVWCDRFFMGLYEVLVLSVQFLFHRWC